MKYVGLKTRPTDLVTQDQLNSTNSVPSGYRVGITGDVNNATNISLPVAPVSSSSIMIFRGMHRSLIDIQDYSVNGNVLSLSEPLSIGESLTIVYIGVSLSDAQLLSSIGDTDTNFVDIFNQALL